MNVAIDNLLIASQQRYNVNANTLSLSFLFYDIVRKLIRIEFNLILYDFKINID